MTLKTILKTTEKFVTDKSPGILTGLGVAGTITTAILTGKGAYSAALQVKDLEYASESEDGRALTSKERFELVWKEFIPAVAVGTATIAAIIMANQIGSRRTAAITAAFKLSEQISEEYKDKVVKTLGIQKEEKMRSELAAEKMNANPPSAGMIIVTGSDVLFLDELSGRYFQSQVEIVKSAVNEINHKVNNYFHASLTDFYELIGLQGTKFSDSIGWNSDELLEVQFSPTIHDDKPAIMLGYNHGPILGYDRLQ
jgi:hypothetical protein